MTAILSERDRSRARAPLSSFHRTSSGAEPACTSATSRSSFITLGFTPCPAGSSIATATFPVARSSANGVSDSTMKVGCSTPWSRRE